MFALAKFMQFAESSALRRELQIKTKDVAFIQQRITRGVIEESPFFMQTRRATESKTYVVESASINGLGEPVSQSRITTLEAFAKACDDILDINARGEVVYKVCFAAGTLVHTDQGLMPIEKIRVGTRVWSQPEGGGARDWRSVINTVATLDQQVYAVQIKVEGAESLTTVIATANHPFWVEAPLTEGEHWMAAECLQPGFVLQLSDGRKAIVHAAGLVLSTQHAHIGFAADDRAGLGIMLDLTEGKVRLAGDAQSVNLATLQLGEPVLTPVYNFEVEDFHTYYAGEAGVWVHNTDCTKTEAIQAAADRAAFEPLKQTIENQCFEEDTLVLAGDGEYYPIEYFSVGEKVMSRCEKTGETAARTVLKTFSNSVDVYYVFYDGPGKFSCLALIVTAEHPIRVRGKGWTPVRELKIGDIMETLDGSPMTVSLVEPAGRKSTVYNLHVEEFQTYFVHRQGIWVHNTKTTPITATEMRVIDKNAIAFKNEWLPDRNALNAELANELSRLAAEGRPDFPSITKRQIEAKLGELDGIEAGLDIVLQKDRQIDKAACHAKFPRLD